MLQEHLDDPFMSAIAYTPTQPHDAPSTPPPVPFPMTRARAGSDSDNSLLSSPSPSVSAGSSTASLADTLIEGDEDAEADEVGEEEVGDGEDGEDAEEGGGSEGEPGGREGGCGEESVDGGQVCDRLVEGVFGDGGGGEDGDLAWW